MTYILLGFVVDFNSNLIGNFSNSLVSCIDLFFILNIFILFPDMLSPTKKSIKQLIQIYYNLVSQKQKQNKN